MEVLLCRRSVQIGNEQIVPLFAVDMRLVIPKMAIVPTLEEVNSVFNSVILKVIEVNGAVRTWGQETKAAEMLSQGTVIFKSNGTPFNSFLFFFFFLMSPKCYRPSQ